MKKTFKDIRQDIILTCLKPLVCIWMWFDAKRKVHIGDGVNFKRKEPYILLANHVYLFDVIHVALRFKRYPYIITSQTLLTKQPTKFLLTEIAHIIPKSKGKNDIKAIKEIFSVIKRGYPILIFPEGNTTYYGETEHIEKATMKLVKKIGVDVITCNVKGGYLSKPRWAKKLRKNRRLELFYNLTIKKEDIEKMSVDDINDSIHQALYNNDYEYQHKKMIPHPSKHLAEGLEDIVYICPFCKEFNTIKTDHNKIICTSCKKEGYIDKFGFIHNFKFDNLVDWNNFQRQHSEKIRNSVIEGTGFLNYVEYHNKKQIPVGKVKLKHEKGNLIITGALNKTISIPDLENITLTLRRDLGFFYEDKYFLINMDKNCSSFLRILQDKY